MTKAFWILAAVDGFGLLALLVAGLNQRGHNDGGREMGLLFFVLLPMLVLSLACLAFWMIPVQAVRWILLAVLALPGSFYLFLAVGESTRKLFDDPSKGFTNPAMRETVRAVAKLDVEDVRKWSPNMDKAVDQSRVDAPLRMVIESMVKEINTRLPAQIGRHLEIVKLLLENGAKPNEALELACWTKSESLLRLMFAHGADPNFVNQYGSNAFLGCLGGGMVVGSSLPATKAFVDAGANFKKPTQYGTPLKFALNCGNYDVALYLIEKGADPKTDEIRDEIRTKLQTPSASGPPAELSELARHASLK